MNIDLLVILVFIFIGTFLAINLFSLIKFNKTCYNRAFHGEKLLMRTDFTQEQMRFIKFAINRKLSAKSMALSIIRAPKNVLFAKMNERPVLMSKEIGDLWDDDLFVDFIKSDIKLWIKKNPELAIVLTITVSFCLLLRATSRMFRGNVPNLSKAQKLYDVRVEGVYEDTTFSRYSNAA